MISSHMDLATAIEGKRILHMNSMGKDAVLCLEWLTRFAKPASVVSCYFKLEAGYPTDESYWNYLKKRYPSVEFIEHPCIPEINEKMEGMFQSPLWINYVMNRQEYDSFDGDKAREELRVRQKADYVCSGISCYEGMGRALYLRRVGLLHEERKAIYPLGLMKQAQVMELLKNCRIKLNPSYKFADGSFDSASYFKMHAALKARPDYKKTMYTHYPMLALDEYRWKVLFGKR